MVDLPGRSILKVSKNLAELHPQESVSSKKFGKYIDAKREA